MLLPHLEFMIFPIAGARQWPGSFFVILPDALVRVAVGHDDEPRLGLALGDEVVSVDRIYRGETTFCYAFR